MRIELPWVDQELVADIAQSYMKPHKLKKALEFLDTFDRLEKQKLKEKGASLSLDDVRVVFDDAKREVPGGYEAFCEEEDLENVVQFEISDF